MFKLKIIFSFLFFSILLLGTSYVKNQSREIEKKILKISKKTLSKEKDLNESQLDFYYLSSPAILEKKIRHLDNNQYFPMESSKIFLNLYSFENLQNKYVIKKNRYDKKK